MLFGNKAKEVFSVESVTSGVMDKVLAECANIYKGKPYWLDSEDDIKTINFAKNGNYSLNVELAPDTVDPDNDTLYPIVFTVEEIKDWDPADVAL